MLGRLLGYEVNNKEIRLKYERNEATITIINDGVVNFFCSISQKREKL